MIDFGSTGELLRERPVEFRNDSGEEIPAFGCIRLTGCVEVNKRRILTAAKPDTYGSQYSHRFNGPLPVADGKYGVCYGQMEVPALYDTADGTPAFGERWGPRASTWKLKKNTGGWQIVGNADATNGVVIVTRSPFTSFHGKTDAAHNIDATGTVSIYYRSSSSAYTDTTVNMSSVLNVYGNVASGKDVRCQWDDDGTTSGVGWWEIVAGRCS